MGLLIRLLRATLGLCALLLVLAALYVSLGRELVPLVAEYRDEVQARAQAAVGMPLSIGHLEGGWSGFDPILTAHDVQLGEGADVVRLDQVRVVPDMLASLLARQPRIANLQLEGLQLSLRQAEDGRWTVEGLPQREPAAAPQPQKLIDALQMVAKVSLLGSQLTLEPRGREPLSLTYIDLTLRSGSVRQHLDGRLLLPDGQPLVVSLDRLLPYLEQQKLEQRAVQVSLDPPLIFHSTRPATLLGFYGAPEFRPVGDSGLQAAVNTPATVLLDAAADGPAYYLLLGESWLTTRSLRDGPWTQPAAMPAGFAKLPEESWGELRQAGTGKHLAETPAVYYAEAPAELLITRGAPKYRPVRGTKLQAISNTESAAFLHLGERRHYLLIAGRWFRAASLEGPWETATTSLPADFAKIPETDPLAWVLASVPGTEAAEDAVRLASVPQKATLQRADLKFSANYAGEPRFRPIAGSDGVRYATNASDPVLAVADRYYAVKDGVWFEAAAPAGPWQVCTSVPPALYTIPASSPMHNVTYVQVYDSTPTTVTTGYTAGYNGQYVMNGLLLFGAGMALGYALHDHDDDYWYRPWYWGGAPRPYYSYGYGAVYRPGYGYGAAGWARGPYAAAAGRTWYNPATGAWARGGAELPTENKAAVDLVLPDEFPLNVFYEALRKKLAPAIEATRGMTGAAA